MSNDAIRRDLHNKIATQFEEMFVRELRLAQTVLSGPDLGVMLISLSAGIGVALISVVVQLRKDEANPGMVFDYASQSIADLVAGKREEVLDGVALIRAGKAGEAVARYGNPARRGGGEMSRLRLTDLGAAA